MNAVITGANRGLGKAMVKIFAENGYDIWACARRYNKQFEDELIQLGRKTGANIAPVYFDLTNADEVKIGMKAIISEKKSIDVLINNAGITYAGHLMTMTPIDEIKNVYEVNVFSQIRIMQYIARSMIKQKRGLIINMCSVGGIEPTPESIAYGSSKAALIWITKSLARELSPYNIRVNGIAPGIVDTDMGHYRNEEELAKVFDKMTVKRFGKPEEIAAAALYLSSKAAEFMNGQIMILDGGRV